MIKCFSADEYPVFKEVDTQNSFIILKKELKDIILKVIFNVAIDEARPSLRGVCLNVKDDEVEAVASDGYRLALAKAQINNNGVIDKIVVPAKSMNELARLIDEGEETVTVFVEKNYIMVDLFHTKIVTRLIGEDYINYEKIIPSVFTTSVTVDKKVFENAIDRVSLINRAEKNPTSRWRSKKTRSPSTLTPTTAKSTKKSPSVSKARISQSASTPNTSSIVCTQSTSRLSISTSPLPPPLESSRESRKGGCISFFLCASSANNIAIERIALSKAPCPTTHVRIAH